MNKMKQLLTEVQACQICAPHLAHGVRPILQVGAKARIIIAGQAPGRKGHEGGVPFEDASGDRLRTWMGVTKETFYDPNQVAILPMGFCYPGKGKSGDLPPRKECAPAWREALLKQMGQVELILVIGQYAQAYHLLDNKRTLTETVKAWRDYWPAVLPLPHPSPRNNIWLKRNAWFEAEVVPQLQKQVAALL